MLLKDAMREAKGEPGGFSSAGNSKGGDSKSIVRGVPGTKLPCRWESRCPLTVSVVRIPQ